MGKATTKKIKNCVIVVFCYNCLLNALKNRVRIKECIFGLINTNDDDDKPTKSMEKVLFIQNVFIDGYAVDHVFFMVFVCDSVFHYGLPSDLHFQGSNQMQT